MEYMIEDTVKFTSKIPISLSSWEEQESISSTRFEELITQITWKIGKAYCAKLGAQVSDLHPAPLCL